MSRLCPTATRIGTTLLDGYELVFCRYATIEKIIGGVVPVGIWSIDDNCENELDQYEGYPSLYRKEYIDFMFNNNSYIGMCYLMNSTKRVIPDNYYYNVILSGYKHFNIDEKYLKEALERSKLINNIN
jgi:gamma-glutamylcyclotransferase (GGCT)/AIG2-like uncharacterized protein YtfP